MAEELPILFVNPWIYDFAAYNLWSKPLGLLYIGGLLRQNGYKPYLIDCLDHESPNIVLPTGIKIPKKKDYGVGKFIKELTPKPSSLRDIPRNYSIYGIPESSFIDVLKKIPSPKAILISESMTYWYPGAYKAIRILKEAYPSSPVILGGIYATLCPEHAQNHSGADLFIEGEGEIKVLELLDNLFDRQPHYLPNYDDLDSYSLPALDLYPKISFVPLLTSRGCPFRCTYCASAYLFPHYRKRSPERIIEEVEHWYDLFNVRDFVLYDDSALVDSERYFVPFLERIIAKGLKVNFHTPNALHARFITVEVARLLKKANFKTIRLGFESINPEFQRESGMKVTTVELQTAIKNLSIQGYSRSDIGVYILTGLPGQTRNEVEDSITTVARMGGRPIIAEYSPIPKTVLWGKAKSLSPFDIESEPLYHNNSILPCRSKNFTTQDLQDLKKLQKKINRDDNN